MDILSPLIAGSQFARQRYDRSLTNSHIDAHFGALAARAILCPINTRLKPHEVAYILEHSGSSIILVDHEYTHLIEGTKIPYIISSDTGRDGDPYETFLSEGRIFSQEGGWQGLEVEADENASAVLCYTYAFFIPHNRSPHHVR